MLTLKLQTGELGLDLAGHFMTSTKIEHASNDVHFWTKVASSGKIISASRMRFPAFLDRIQWKIVKLLTGNES